MQSQLVCSGCRSILLYPRGATNVCCALCNTVTSVPPPGMEMSQLYCGGCRTLLMYTRGAPSVRCSCCQTVNLAPGLYFLSLRAHFESNRYLITLEVTGYDKMNGHQILDKMNGQRLRQGTGNGCDTSIFKNMLSLGRRDQSSDKLSRAR